MSNPFVELISSYRTRSGSAFVHEHLVALLARLKKSGVDVTLDQLYVKTKIDGIVEDVLSKKIDYRVIILTGDAGDGKTCVGERLSREGAGRNLTRPVEDMEIRGEPWKFIKDASENQAEIPEVIQDALDGKYRLLIAANEGKLRAESSKLGDVWTKVIEPSLYDRHDDAQLQILDAEMRERGVLVVNFRMRSEVETLTNGILLNWTMPAYWQSGSCGNCPKSEVCPILHNATDLRNESNRKSVVRLISWLALTGQRLPVRRLQGLLAYILTGGSSCLEVLNTTTVHDAKLVEHRYWNAPFLRRSAEPAAAQLSQLNAEAIANPSRDAEILRTGIRSEGVPGARNQMSLNSKSSEWATALQLTALENSASLVAEVTRALNYLSDAPDNSEALSNIVRDPGSLTEPNLSEVRIRFGSQTELGLRRLPKVPPAVQQYLGDKADRLEVYLKDDPTISLRINVILINRMISLRVRRLSPVSLGHYLPDIQRFLRRIVVSKQSSTDGDAQIVVSNKNGGKLSVKFLNDKLQLNHFA